MMKIILVCFFILCVACNTVNCAPTAATFDVSKFGAKSDGKTDDTKAFSSAWAAACSAKLGNPTILVPSGMSFLLSPIRFEGPCKSTSITFQILGSIVAHAREAYKGGGGHEWICFHQVDGLSVVGNKQGLIDGNGPSWWTSSNQNSRPTAMRFSSCKRLKVSGLKHKDSQRNHISINECSDALISNLRITAPATSPNTDGIDIVSSTNVFIQDSVMETGDDCIAINGGNSNIMISKVTCGPGHGISVGSLGKNGAHEEVSGINVQNCTFIKSDNGVRIKTWQGGSGFAKNITFSNIKFVSVKNPVIIDQNYCPHQSCKIQNKGNAVSISDVRYSELTGTAICNKKPTINLSCSSSAPCTGIEFDDVDIDCVDKTKAYATCANARGSSVHSYPTLGCLLK